SGGEAKRVALARSLAPRPRVLLLDEPLTGLDRELHDRLVGELAAILRAEQTTSLLVTHDREEAAAIADRILTIAEVTGAAGIAGAVGPTADLTVTTVPAAAVRDLRRRVLRRGTPTDDVEFAGDD